MACPPKVLIRWMASWMTKTSRMREGKVNMVAEYWTLSTVYSLLLIACVDCPLFLKFVGCCHALV
jgi:hypothetical protein